MKKTLLIFFIFPSFIIIIFIIIIYFFIKYSKPNTIKLVPEIYRTSNNQIMISLKFSEAKTSTCIWEERSKLKTNKFETKSIHGNIYDLPSQSIVKISCNSIGGVNYSTDEINLTNY